MSDVLRNAVKSAAKMYFKFNKPKRNLKKYIPVSGKVLDNDDLCNLIDVSLDMWLTTGRFNDEFEKNLSEFLHVKYAATTNSGSSANLLALSALTSYKLGEKQLKKGDEVITVASGFPTTVNPIIQLGLIPVFVDCNLETCNIDETKLEQSLTEKTKAIFVAHTLGNPYNLDKILEICKKYSLWLIEDSCDALGATYKNQNVGTVGHIGTFSFYPAHHITMGEGGAVVTNDTQLHRIILSFRDWGRDCWCKPGHDNTCKNRFAMQFGNLPLGYDHKYTYSHIGYNLKITDWQAAIGLSQLKKLPKFLEKRTENANYLINKLKDLEKYFIFPKVDNDSKPSWFGLLLSVKQNDKFTKQQLVEYLEQNGVGTRQLFAGNILRQPMMTENEIPLRIGNSTLLLSNKLTENEYKLLPNADYIMNNTFWVGVFPALGKKEMDKISKLVHDFIKEKIK
ncbi:lipopolysaccharide biosynthesis protein RfbH [Candidatus Ruminimicrobium bovinum]|uniref:lipopolysaccharide biosynthesis protein RfbH n=1 Tax=Candidatus Ruminimicrobium bovinum TaxID=3242779 RepID=UPI0039B85690